jgi:hypothetical protein
MFDPANSKRKTEIERKTLLKTLNEYEQAEMNGYMKRHESWKVAFKSVYYSYRNGKFDQFYFENTAFSVWFLRSK